MTDYGYMRVSTEDQKTDLQYDALIKAGIAPENIFKDVITGASTKREELMKLLEIVQPEDSITVWKLDRLGRKAAYMFDLVDDLTERGIIFKSLRENFDLSTVYGRGMFKMLGVWAEIERDGIRERTKEGVAAYRARNGGQWGRSSNISEEHAQDILEDALVEGLSIRKLADKYPYSRSAIHRFLKRNVELNEEDDEEGLL